MAEENIQVSWPNISNQPLVDEMRIMAPVWARFFNDFWTRTGGSTDLVGGIEIGKESRSASPNVVIFISASRQTAEDPGSFEYNQSTNTLTIDNIDLTTDINLANFTAGSIPFIAVGGDLSEDNNNLFWNDTSNEFYVGGTTSGTADVILAANGNTTVKGTFRHEGNNVGFYGEAPTTQQTGYTTFANLTINRTLDADATTLGEVADTLGTLIEDLKATGIISA